LGRRLLQDIASKAELAQHRRIEWSLLHRMAWPETVKIEIADTRIRDAAWAPDATQRRYHRRRRDPAALGSGRPTVGLGRPSARGGGGRPTPRIVWQRPIGAGVIRLWRADTLEQQAILRKVALARDVRWHPSGKALVVVTAEGSAHVVSAASGSGARAAAVPRVESAPWNFQRMAVGAAVAREPRHIALVDCTEWLDTTPFEEARGPRRAGQPRSSPSRRMSMPEWIHGLAWGAGRNR